MTIQNVAIDLFTSPLIFKMRGYYLLLRKSHSLVDLIINSFVLLSNLSDVPCETNVLFQHDSLLINHYSQINQNANHQVVFSTQYSGNVIYVFSEWIDFL